MYPIEKKLKTIANFILSVYNLYVTYMRGSTRIVLSVVIFGEASLAILLPGVLKTLPPQELNNNQTLPEDFNYWHNVSEIRTSTTEFPAKLYSSYSGYHGYPFHNRTDQIDGENTINEFHGTLLEGPSESSLEYADRSLGDLVESLKNFLEETLDGCLRDLEDSLDFLELTQLIETTILQTTITEVPMIATKTTHVDGEGYGRQTNYFFDNDGHFAIGRELEDSASKETTSRLEPVETCVISASLVTLTLTSVRSANISVNTESLSLSSHNYINRSQVLHPLDSLKLTMEFPLISSMTSQLSFRASRSSSLALLKHTPKSPLALELLEITPCTPSKYLMSTRRTIIYSSSSHHTFSFLPIFLVFLVHI